MRTYTSFVFISLSLSISGVGLSQTSLEKKAEAPQPQESKPAEKIQVMGKRIQQGSSEILLDERRKSSEVKDVVSSEQIRKSGDSDAGSAMRRVTGLTLIGGKSIYVRGLGERYSSTTLNGLSVPSLDPARRQVQFDLFPSEILESIVVQKSYSPDLSGEFGGGTTLMRTKSIPTRFEARFSMGTGYSADTVNTYQHSRTDALGFDDGQRSLPTPAKEQSLTQTGGLTGAQREAVSESFTRSYDVRQESAPINRNLSASIGDRFTLGSQTPIGYSLGAIYGDEWERYDRIQNDLTSDQSTVIKGKRGDVSERTIKLGGIGTLSADVGDNKYRALFGILRKTTDAVDITDSFYNTASVNEIRSTRLQWQERELTLRQLYGEHTFGDAGDYTLSWKVGANSTKRVIPDQRSYGYTDRGDEYVHEQSETSRLRRKWADNDENMQEAQIDLVARAYEDDDNQVNLKFGVLGLERKRNSGARDFYFTPAAGENVAASLGSQSLEQIYTPENMRYNETRGQSYLLAEELTLPSDTYKARQEQLAYYGMVQYKFADTWDVTTGVRNETSVQKVDSVDSYDNVDPFKKAELSHDALLPVLNATWAFQDRQQLRFAYSQTLTRPDFRELSVSSYYDYERGFEITGNPDLEVSDLNNFDLRWELYTTPQSYVSAGGFYKQISKPIEQIPDSFDGANTSGITYANARSARNYGLEFETNQVFGPFSVGGNYSRIFSEIKVKDDPNGIRYSNTDRPMQGAAPYIINVNTGLAFASTGSEVNLVYNRVGERIMEAGIIVGDIAIPDVKDVPIDNFDLVLSQALEPNYNLRFRARNMLGRDIEYKVADTVVYQRTQDAAYSVSLSAAF